MRQQAPSGQGEIPARTSGHGAIPPGEATPTTKGMSGAGKNAGSVPLNAKICWEAGVQHLPNIFWSFV